MSYFEDIIKKANEGDAQAQCSLGFAYMLGEDIERDYILALEWLKKSSKQGFAEAYRHIAELYMNGHGVIKSVEMAIYYSRMAELKGDRIAKGLKLRYQKSRMGELSSEPMVELWHYYMREPRHFIEFYEKAIEVENPNGPFRLGYIYEKSGDYENAIKYYKIGEERKAGDAIFRLGYLYENGYGVDKSRLRAYSYYRRAEMYGDSNALNAVAYSICKSVPTSDAGIDRLKKAAMADHPVAKLNLAFLYATEPSLGATFDEKTKYFIEAAEKDNTQAKAALGYLYMNNKDYQLSLKYFMDAGGEGNIDAEFMAGFVCEHHLDSMNSAAFHYKNASDKGHPLAKYYLSECYRDGRGVTQDEEKADRLFEESGIGEDI